MQALVNEQHFQQLLSISLKLSATYAMHKTHRILRTQRLAFCACFAPTVFCSFLVNAVTSTGVHSMSVNFLIVLYQLCAYAHGQS